MADTSPERSSQAPEENKDVKPTIAPSQEVKSSPEGVETKEETKTSLNKLKKDIESGKMSFELVKTYLESLDKVSDKDYKAFILGGILSGLNQRGISIEGVRDGKINLKAGIQSLREKLNIATHEETISYQNLINNYLSAGKISISDLNKALMYRTSSLDNFLNEKVDGQKTKTSEYVLRLLEKYKISVSGPSLETFKFETEVQYTSLKNMIKSSITDNQADKEFLLAYFDDIYYNGRKGLSENSTEDYKKSSTKIEAGLFNGLNKLSEDQKYSLGIKSQDDTKEIARKWKNNPLEAAKEAFTNGGGLLGLILGLIGSIFWGKKGFLGGFIGGMALVGGGPAFAGEMLNKGMDKLDGKGKKGNSAEEKPSETNSLFDKFKGKLEANSGNLDKKELSKKWEELSKNKEFLKAHASLLKIFETEKDGVKITEELKKYGIELSEENKEFYKCIFAELVKDRNENIGEYENNEQIGAYLNRTSKKIDNKPAIVGATTATVSGYGLKEGTKLASNQRLDKDSNMLSGEFETKAGVEYLKNGERRSKDNTKIETFKDGKLIYTYEGTFDKENKFTGIVKYNDGTGKIDIFENGERKEYTLEYIGGLMGLLGITLAPSAAGPFGVVASGVLGVGYSIADLFNQDEDLLWDILKSVGAVDPRFEGGKKTFWDNAFAAAGLIPGLKQAGLIAKISKYTAKLPPDKLEKITKIAGSVSEKLAEKTKGMIKLGDNVKNGVLSPKQIEELAAKRDLLNKEAAKVGKTKDEIDKINKEINEIESAIRNSQNGANGAKESAKTFPGKFENTKSKIKGFLENREAGKIFTSLENGKSLKIGETEFTKLSNGKYGATINGVSKELDNGQLLKYIENLPIEIKQEFILSTKQAKILEKNIGQVRKIDGHEVEILNGGKWKIRAKNGTILNEQETAEFVSRNTDKLAKEFKFVSITEGGLKAKEGVIAGYEKYGIKTFWDYLEKAGYANGKKSTFFGDGSKKLDFLGGIVLTPATTIRQLISAIPNKEWENMFRILIGGNKNIKVWGEGGVSRLWNSGLTNAGITYGLVNYDDIVDTDTSRSDEVGDAAFYRFGGILNTIAAKYMGIID